MKLDYLWVEKFKNLEDFRVDFDENPKELIAVLLGRNGYGKSNLLELLVVIFRDLFLGTRTDFAYELRYTLQRGSTRVAVENRPQALSPKERFSFIVSRKDGSEDRFGRSDLKDPKGQAWLPRHVFAYYSGPSDRLEEHFRPHQKQFYKDLLDGKESAFRPLFYARPVHSNFVLLAFFMKEDQAVRNFLQEHLRIENLESVLFVLRKPPKWADRRQDGDIRFWRSIGTVREFLSKLWEVSLAPMRLAGKIPDGLDNPKPTEFIYLYLRDLKALRALATKSKTPAEFFKELESTYISDLIHETRIRVKVRQHDGSLTFRELSEGEQQLVTVVGLLRFTKETESLFLLDEPDTHLNPAWGIEYLDILNKIADTGSDSQIVIATHDPLMISGLRKEQVVVLDREEADGRILADHPEVDPQGLGISGILKSSMFGLRTTLDLPTQRLLDERFELVAKGAQRTEEQTQRLRELADTLAAAGFADDFRDTNYARYAQALGQVKFADKLTLTPSEIEQVNVDALQAVREILAEDRKH